MQIPQDNPSEQAQKKQRSKSLSTVAKILEADGIAEHKLEPFTHSNTKVLAQNVMTSATEGSGHCYQELTWHFRD